MKPFPQECFNTSFVTMKYWFLKKIRMWEKKGGGGIPTTMKNGKRTNFDQKALRLAFGSGELIRV